MSNPANNDDPEQVKLDQVGPWSEIKLQIIREYSKAYTNVLKNQPYIRHYGYIDGYAGWGSHISKQTNEEIEGSPIIALQNEFSSYHFVDLDGSRAERLKRLSSGKENVTVHEGDCNKVLLEKVFPLYRWEDYRRALCLLDPYNLNPKWEVVQKAGEMKSIEIFLNFMIMDANLNVLKKNPDNVLSSQIMRMNEFWGDESWKNAAYKSEDGLFGVIQEKETNEAVVNAYCKRLREVAGFKYIPKPLPMKIANVSNKPIIYYLIFASNNETGHKIAQSIFNKYRT